MITNNFISSAKKLIYVPKNNERSLDGIRALSILWVFSLHLFIFAYPQQERVSLDVTSNHSGFLQVIANGSLAVDVFFVLSGFLISGILFNEINIKNDINLKVFYLRRIIRLSPALILLGITSYLLKAENYENTWISVLYIINFIPINEAAIPWTWSLAVEEQFYIICPIIFLMVSKKRRALAIILLILVPIIISLMVAAYIENPSEILYYQPATRFSGIGFGVLAQYVYFYQKKKVHDFFDRKISLFLSILSIIAVIMIVFSSFLTQHHSTNELPYFYFYNYVFIRSVFSFLVSYLIISILCDHYVTLPAKKILKLKVWYPVAQLSYSMYLFHIPVIAATLKYSPEYFFNMIDANPNNFGSYLFIWLQSLLVTIFLSTIIYIFLERPCMDMRPWIEKKVTAIPQKINRGGK